MLSAIMLNVTNKPFMLSAIMLNVVMLSIVAPLIGPICKLRIKRNVTNEPTCSIKT
jgi:hypothetical protein